ncbi:hypothetical protein CLU79DRAFT_741084 [Phycomyces nitens]|nr:hypothetical protein CLU79DRAFT_741084 [Phycomyces nitens]
MVFVKTCFAKRIGIVSAILLFLSTVNAGCAGELKATSQGELDSIRGCKVYSGSIIVDNSGATDLTLNGVEMVEGDVIFSGNNGLLRLTMPVLQSVNGKLSLSNNKLLASIEMRQLASVRGFEVSVHPALNSLAFPAGLGSAERFSVTDTTVTRIDGLKMPAVGELVISNNIYLKNLSFGNMTQLTGSITMAANSPSLSLDLASLINMNQGSFRNVANVAFDNLEKISGDVFFISNSFSTLSLPKITGIEGTLTITDNSQLSTLSMPELTHLGGALSLGNNNHLTSVDAFPKLEEVDGTLDITGTFDEVMLPGLMDVRGGLNVQTSSSHFSCDGISKLKSEVIKGNAYVCKSAVSKPKSGMPGKGGSNSFDDSSSAISIKAGWAGILTALGLSSALILCV